MLPKQQREIFAGTVGSFSRSTSGLCPGYLQANVLMLPVEYALDFLDLCVANPAPLPLIKVLSPGRYEFVSGENSDCIGIACRDPSSDLRKCIPKYRIYQRESDGSFSYTEATDVTAAIGEIRLVSFLLGCSFSFERALTSSGVPVRNVEQGKNVSMFITNRVLVPAGVFKDCPLVVSMRPVPAGLVDKAIEVTKAIPAAHGAPVHVGDPAEMGISNIAAPDFGEAVVLKRSSSSLSEEKRTLGDDDDICVFWACGVTAIEAGKRSEAEFFISHAPGSMLILDISEFDARTMNEDEIEAARNAIKNEL